MAVNPFTKERLVVGTLIEFVNFDEKGVCVLEEGISIVKSGGVFEIFEGEKQISRVRDRIIINPEFYDTTKTMNKEMKELIQNIEKDQLEKIGEALPLGFTPPHFGVTVLGASHGFDVSGSTTGFILWINQRGIMIDPPPFSSHNLASFGIPPNLIDKCILTHCHADHDSGIFQKIMHSNTIELITTSTIISSFTRKYSALTQLPLETFRAMFLFRPVTIGNPIDILGATFRFFYSYHSIPCIGFEVTFCGKTIFFSGDTYYDPDGLKERFQRGIFSKDRYESLVGINWNKYDLILHEAGVPPIHTPTKVLANLPEEIKKKLLLVHIAEKDVPKTGGLIAAKVGLMNTIILNVTPQVDSTILKLDLLASIKFLNEIPLYKTRDLVRCCKVETFMPGQLVIREGTFGSKFYIVMSGICKIYSDNPSNKFSKFAYTGDYFGETALIDQGKRNAK